MRIVKRTTEIAEFDTLADLPEPDRELIEAARKAYLASWAPYSQFTVGAALRLANGVIVTGCNVENAAFPSGICAEHNAISTAASTYPGIPPVSIAITAAYRNKPVEQPVSPCGKCRQIIAEEESRYGKAVRIIMAGSQRIRVIERGSDLLPLLFSGRDIKP